MYVYIIYIYVYYICIYITCLWLYIIYLIWYTHTRCMYMSIIYTYTYLYICRHVHEPGWLANTRMIHPSVLVIILPTTMIGPFCGFHFFVKLGVIHPGHHPGHHPGSSRHHPSHLRAGTHLLIILLAHKQSSWSRTSRTSFFVFTSIILVSSWSMSLDRISAFCCIL